MLGPIEVRATQQPVRGYESVKALALLCYLAARDQPVRRQHVIHLFWGDKSEARGRNNLSVVLHNLSGLLPGLLKADRQTVQLASDANYWCDTRAFADLASRNDAASLAAAAALYRGEFLEDLALKDCPEFDIWLATEREAWRQQITRVLQRLIEYAFEQQAYPDAQGYTARLLDIDPLNEPAHRQMMRVLVLLDQRSAALEQYRTCCRLLEAELGIAPEDETTSLYDQIRSGALGPPDSAASTSLTPPHNLPHPAGPTIGRAAELAHIAALLHSADCRLLTLTGLGGIGKTHLALRTAWRCLDDAAAYPDGVWFVPLAQVDAAEHIAATLVSALALPVQGAREVQEQLLAALRPRRMLLVLDNLEHLLAASDLLADILAAAPGLKFLCTSRERLNLPAEWVLEVGGLDVPDQNDSAALTDYSAIQLFVQRAAQVQAGFALTDDNRAAVIQLCRDVEGIPLALELAATWLNVLPCAAIVHELEQTLEILASRLRGVPARHRSMHAVFDHSWQLLNPTEQHALLGLAVFRGGALREAAEHVAGVTLPLLAALLDKSLLRRSEPERYSLHELLRQYVGEQLARHPALHEHYRSAHRAYWLAFLQQRQGLLFSPHEKAAMDEVAADIENIRLAWRDALTSHAFAALDGALRTLAYFYYVRGWLHEGEHVFAQTTAVLRQANAAGNASLAMTFGKALTYQGLLRVFLGRHTAGRDCLQPALALLHHPSAVWERGLANVFMGLTAFRIGDHEQAYTFAHAGLAIAQTMGDTWMQGFAMSVVGYAAQAQGRLPEAAAVFRRLVEGSRALGDQRAMGMYMCELSSIYHAQGQRAQCYTMWQHSLEVFATIQHRAGTALVLDHLGRAYYDKGNYPEAVAQFRASLAISREVGDTWDMARVLAYLGHALLAVGDDAAARACFEEAATLAVQVETHSALLDALVGIALLLDRSAHPALALALMHRALHHPACHVLTRERAQRLYDRLVVALPASAQPVEATVHELAAGDIEQVILLGLARLDRRGATE
jgi:predicted ATPase/DNA-binding SARP family transcriptional activator